MLVTIFKLIFQTVLIIETVLITVFWTTVGSYGTYNRDILKILETVLIIESVLIIET